MQHTDIFLFFKILQPYYFTILRRNMQQFCGCFGIEAAPHDENLSKLTKQKDRWMPKCIDNILRKSKILPAMHIFVASCLRICYNENIFGYFARQELITSAKERKQGIKHRALRAADADHGDARARRSRGGRADRHHG
ncbi:MAG TPA: hypothetical protein IAD00_01775 [Candidatus Fimenecus stercoravium]|nr:hypothetical protein [Candidatus Fimenecus stercoravium]